MLDLTDLFDLHAHSAPDVYPRCVDDVELARQAQQAGMRALLLKSHHTLTADRAALVAQQTGMTVYGGLALNQTVGGLNPVAVETAIAFGARQIWMPTIHAAHCLRVGRAEMFRREAERGRRGISVLAADGSLAPDVPAVLELIRDADIILGTGHLAPEESLVLLKSARDMGVQRMLVTHPLMPFTRFSIDQMRGAAVLGAHLEFDALSCRPGWPEAVAPAETAVAIRAVGAGRCVLASDGGQADNPPPPDMLHHFAHELATQGIADADLKTMLCENPARLLLP